MKCKKCQSENLKIIESGPHKKLVCGDCLSFQKFLSKAEANTFLQLQSDNNMNCLEIVKNYLISNGFDGLQAEAECGCEIDDLVPCGNDFSQCTPGYKVFPPDDGDFDFYICGSKKDRPWE